MAMFETGDYVICRSGGVWRVSALDGDQVRLIEHGSGTANILPNGNEEIVRKIASKETILDAIERIAFVRTIQAPTDRARRKLYDEAMSKYDEIEWVKVIKTVFLRQKIMGSLKPSELEYLERAKRFFHAEISILLGMPVEDVEDYVSSAISSN
jgi:CarD family transcriptional regulator